MAMILSVRVMRVVCLDASMLSHAKLIRRCLLPPHGNQNLAVAWGQYRAQSTCDQQLEFVLRHG